MENLIERINELTRISRERELTEPEKNERAELRQKYVAGFKNSLVSTLDNTYIMDEQGNKKKLEKKKGRTDE